MYSNLCLTVIAGCLIYLCYRATTTDTSPTKVEIVEIASQLNTPIPCKLMYKKESDYSYGRTQWTDEGTLGVQLAGGERRQERMQVEIVGVASNIRTALPIKAKQKGGGLFGSTSSNDGAIAVRLVGIEKPRGQGKWHAIPVRGPASVTGEAGGLFGSYPVEVKVTR